MSSKECDNFENVAPMERPFVLTTSVCQYKIMQYRSENGRIRAGNTVRRERNKTMVLYVNACVRKESRTERIAGSLLRHLDVDLEEVRLSALNLQPLSEERLIKRTELIERRDYSDPMFRLARQFQQADEIVIAAPYWDLSFPAILKMYLENIYVTGLVSEYTETGEPRGLCRAKKLWYVTTAGGPYLPDYSYAYLRTMVQDYFAIGETELIAAEMLDVQGFDAESIVENKIKEIDTRFR